MKHLKISISLIIVLALFFITNRTYAMTGKVITDTLKLRKTASTDSAVLELISMDDKIEILDKQSNGWYKVVYKDITGFVSGEYVKIEGEQTSTDNKKKSNQTDNSSNTDNTSNSVNNNEESKDETSTLENEQADSQEEATVLSENISETEENANEIAEEVWEGVAKQTIKVYATPLINALQINEIKATSKVQIISKANGWCYVVCQDIIGWIRIDKLEVSKATIDKNSEKIENKEEDKQEEVIEPVEKDTNKNEYDTSKTAYIKEVVVNIRKQPNETSEKIMVVVQNTKVELIGEEGDWYKVKINNKTGYVLKTLISDSKVETTTRQMEEERDNPVESVENTNPDSNVGTSSASGQKIVEYAMKFLGCNYVYGATGPTTFDCSGFTQYVYKNFGYNLTRTATSQSHEGTQVSKSNLMPGDLIIFYNNNLTAIGHVGIYIGGGRFIHASSYAGLKCLVTGKTGNMVKVSDLTSGEYAKRFHSAVRILK